jgi:hypothetical protein
MRDFTNALYNDIKSAVQALYSNAVVSKQYQSESAQFPCVTIVDIDNPEISHTLDYKERFSKPSWQIDIYADGSTGEIVAKKIRDVIIPICEDDYHLTRIEAHTVVNAADTTIYRYMLRYNGILNESSGIIGS